MFNERGKWIKGAIILNAVDDFCSIYPDVLDYFIIIERRGWHGPNTSKKAHIKLVEDLSCWDETRESSSEAILLDIGPADFVDTDAFKPLGIEKDYIGLQISNWEAFKRHELFVQGVALFASNSPNKVKFVKYGHGSTYSQKQQNALKRKVESLAQKIEAPIEFLYPGKISNEILDYSSFGMNQMINRCNMGILTTRAEGINRFKMECLSANIPVLIPADVSFPTRKHINEKTGVFFEPTPQGLSDAIRYVESHYDQFKPREYVLEHTGIHRSVAKLTQALHECSSKLGENGRFDDIAWDGRNISQLWGEKMFNEVSRVIEETRCLQQPSRNRIIEFAKTFGLGRKSKIMGHALGDIYTLARRSGLGRHYFHFFRHSLRLLAMLSKMFAAGVIKRRGFLFRPIEVFYSLLVDIPMRTWIERRHE